MNVAETAPAVVLADTVYSWPGRSAFRLEIEAFEILAGETVLLLGESGSGKSTLLSLICGIFLPDRGSVVVDGMDLGKLPSSRRDRFRADHIGVIFQMFNLLTYATPLDNVLLPLHFAPARRARLETGPRETAIGLLAALGLSDSLIDGTPASSLSVGQQQRVAVARALIGSPALVVADEPTSALDSRSQDGFLDLLFRQVAAAGSTLLMVSHDERLAERFDRTVHLADIAATHREATA
jgi:putative ABC transport system ATP-binding protein